MCKIHTEWAIHSYLGPERHSEWEIRHLLIRDLFGVTKDNMNEQLRGCIQRIALQNYLRSNSFCGILVCMKLVFDKKESDEMYSRNL